MALQSLDLVGFFKLGLGFCALHANVMESVNFHTQLKFPLDYAAVRNGHFLFSFLGRIENQNLCFFFSPSGFSFGVDFPPFFSLFGFVVH